MPRLIGVVAAKKFGRIPILEVEDRVMFIIMKSSRAYEGAAPINAYAQPETCACADVEPGKVYSTKESAQVDADKLSKCNPVGFVVVSCK
jgi:hypothetical protein